MKIYLIPVLILNLLFIGCDLVNSKEDSQPNPRITFNANNNGYDIFSMEYDGSNVLRLTEGSLDNWLYDYSPDGKKILYTMGTGRDLEIYTLNAASLEKIRLTNNEDRDSWPWFTPDGEKIVFLSDRDGNNEVYIMDNDGSNPINITNHPGNDFDPKVSPNGVQVAFRSDRNGTIQLFLVDLDGSNLIEISQDNDILFDFYSDGSELLILHSNQLYIAGNNASEYGTALTTTKFFGNAFYSRDQRNVFFSAQLDGEYFSNYGIYRYDLHTEQILLLSDSTVSSFAKCEDPEGEFIFYHTQEFTDDNETSQIWRMNIDGTNKLPIFQDFYVNGLIICQPDNE